MASRYDVGAYNAGNYSAASVYEEEFVVSGLWSASAVGNYIESNSATLSALLSMTVEERSITGGSEASISGVYSATIAYNVVTGGSEALISGVFSLAGVGNLTASGGATATAEYTVSAEAVRVRQVSGEAYVSGNFSVLAVGSMEFNSIPLVALFGGFDATVENFSGLFWNPSYTENTWLTEAPLSDIWVKQPETNSPWSN